MNNKLTPAQVNKLLISIKSIKAHLNQQTIQNTAGELAKFENQLTLRQLEKCLTQSPQTQLEGNLVEILAKRWERIRKSSMNYTENPFNIVNTLCLNIATALSPIPKTEGEIDNLEPGKGPYFLLMPSLAVSCDVYLSNIHQYALHQFILSDDERRFIPLSVCLEHSTQSESGEIEHVVSEDDYYSKLTPQELVRLTNHSTPLREYLQAIIDLNQVRVHGDNLGAQLQRLRYALVGGGAHRGGEEYNAGQAANVGIAAFYEYWETVPEEKKEQYYEKYPMLRNIIGRLIRPTDADYHEIQYCVELIAHYIDGIINLHHLDTRSLVELEANSEKKKKLFLTALSSKNYQIAESQANLPKVLPTVFQLNAKTQQAIFKHSGSKNAWLYALEYAPYALIGFRNLLDPSAKQDAILAKFGGRGSTPLMIAASNGCDDAVQLLLDDVGVDIEARDNFGYTALFNAVENGQGDTMNILLAKGADMSARDLNGRNALDIALLSEGSSLIDPLLLHAATLDAEQQKAILSKVSYGVYDNILTYTATFRAELFSQVLALAIDHNHTTILNGRYNIRTVPNVWINFELTVLMMAALYGSGDNVNALLEKGLADIEAQDDHNNTALIWAASSGKLEPLKALLNRGAQKEIRGNQGNTALNFAVISGHRDAVEALLANDADINARNNAGKNAFDLAQKYHPELLGPLLLKAATLHVEQQAELLSGASAGKYKNVLTYAAEKQPQLFSSLLTKVIEQNNTTILNARHTIDVRGMNVEMTLLMMAAAFGCGEDLNKLINDFGADIEARDNLANTALIWAASGGTKDAVNTLLQRGAEIEARGNRGNTALCCATRSKVLESLLAKNADINARNDAGQNALDIALSRYPELLEALLMKAASLDAAKQEAILSQVSGGTYKNILTYIMLEKPQYLSKVFSCLPGKTELAIQHMEKIDFDKHFQSIRSKWLEMEQKAHLRPNSNYRKAADTAKTLIIQMVQATDELFQSGTAINQRKLSIFNRSCINAIDEAKPVLEKHRGWRGVFAVLLLVLTFPISLPLYAAGLFFSIKTDSARKLQAFEESLSSKMTTAQVVR